MSPFSFFRPACAIFSARTRNACLAEARSSMRVGFIRFTSERQNKGVRDGYMSVLCSHQQSALPFQVDRTDVHPVAKIWMWPTLCEMQAHVYTPEICPVAARRLSNGTSSKLEKRSAHEYSSAENVQTPEVGQDTRCHSGPRLRRINAWLDLNKILLL